VNFLALLSDENIQVLGFIYHIMTEGKLKEYNYYVETTIKVI
jgi:hypothetical protein